MSDIRKALDRYDERFPDGFPSFSLFSRGPEEIIAIIEECLKKGKDVTKLGYYIHPDLDVFY